MEESMSGSDLRYPFLWSGSANNYNLKWVELMNQTIFEVQIERILRSEESSWPRRRET